MGTTSQKLTYLNTTKDKLKTAINYSGAGITTDTFRSYPEKLYSRYLDEITNGTSTLFNNLPKATGSGTSVTLNDTAQCGLKITYKATDTTQSGTPTPSSPQAIHYVTGENSISISVKNLFNFNNTYYTSSADVSLTINGNDLQVVNNSSSSYGYIWWNTTIPEVNEYYTLSYTSMVESSSSTYNNLQYRATSEPITSYADLGNPTSVIKTYQSISLKPAESNIVIVLRVNKSANYTISGIQLEKGNSVTTYEPVTMYPITLKSKNLFGVKWGTGSNGICHMVMGDGSILTFGTATSASNTISTANAISYGAYIPLEAGTYAVSGGKSSSKKIQVYTTSGTQKVNQNVSGTFTLDTKTNVVVRLVIASGVFCNNEMFYVQLEKGSTVTSFVPHIDIKLCKIGNYQDSIFYNETDTNLDLNCWYLKEEIGKLLLKGNEGWTIKSTGTANWRYSLETGIIPVGASPIISSHYQKATISSGNTTEGIDIGATGELRIRYGTEDTVANYKTWLQNNNVEVYFQLATPKYTKITDENLISQLKAIKLACENKTNILQANGDLPFELEVSAVKKYE